MKKFKLFQLLLVLAFCSNSYAQYTNVDFEAGGQGASWTWIMDQNGSNPPLTFPTNPVSGGINTSATVAQFEAQTSGQPWALTYTDDMTDFIFDATNTTVKIKVYKSVISNVGVKFEGPGTNIEILIPNTVTNQWEELTYDFSAHVGKTCNRLVIIPDFTARAATHTLYFDDIQIPAGNIAPPPPVLTPTTAAPTPPAEACVISIFSDSYTDVAGTDFDPNWGQATDATIQMIAGNNTLQYMGINYQGTAFGSNQDVSAYGFLHVDFWTDNSTALNFYLISPGVENAYNLIQHNVAGQWVSVDIPLSDFNANKANVFQFKVDGNGNVWFDNLYFHGGTDANVSLPPMGAPTNITCTTSCTDGDWTYYEHPTNPGTYLFAIEWGSGNSAAKAAATVTIDVQSAPFVAPGSSSAAASVAMARYWNVNTSALASPVNVKFYYDSAEEDAVNSAITTYGTSNGFKWYKNTTGDYTHSGIITAPDFASSITYLTPASTGTENGVNYVQFDGITSFSGGSGAAGVGAALPVELLSFEGRALESINQLNWATSTEKNTQWHIIERSSNAKSDWIEIGRVAANGNAGQHYELMDKAPITNGYYRIHSIDFDSRAQYSNIIRVARAGVVGDIIVYPNPITNHLNVDFTTLEEEVVRLTVADLTGRLVFNEIYVANRGHNNYRVNFDHLKSGVYFITMTNTNGSTTKRLVKN